MDCPKCGAPLPEDLGSCGQCGAPAPNYSAPEGFAYDEASGLYYQDFLETEPGSSTLLRIVTWYSPQTGRYERTVYPAEEGGYQGSGVLAAKNAERKNKKALVIAGAAVVLVAAAGIAAWAMDWLPLAGPEDKAGVRVAVESQTLPADKADEPGPTADWRIDSQEKLKEVLLKLEIEKAAGTLTLSPQQMAELEESMKLLMSEKPEMAEEIDQLLQLLQELAAAGERQSLDKWANAAIYVTASSTLPASAKYSYDASNVLDGSPDTAWAEGAEGNGVNQWIMLTADAGERALLSKLSILNGYQRTESTYYANGRIKEIEIEFSDGSTIQHTLADSTGWQNIPLVQQVETSSVRIIIKSVYAGSSYEDTCIGGITCY